MILSAPFLLTFNRGLIFGPGAVYVRDGQIIDAGKRKAIVKKYPKAEEQYFDRSAILPGLINMRAYLDDVSLDVCESILAGITTVLNFKNNENNPSLVSVLSNRKLNFRNNDNSTTICPRSFAVQEVEIPEIKKLLSEGKNIALGTDGRPTVNSLDLFDDMALLKEMQPALACEQLLRIAINGGANALGLSNELGVISPGFRADIIALEFCHSRNANIYEELITEDHLLRMAMVDGVEVLQ